MSFIVPRMRRAESVPSDINNRIDHTAEIPLQFDTLPKAITKRASITFFFLLRVVLMISIEDTSNTFLSVWWLAGT